MITISKELALQLLMERVEYWVSEKESQAQWKEYLADWLDRGYEIELDPSYIIDNMFINELEFIDKKEIADSVLGIETEINLDNCVGNIDYIGEDFVVVLL